jgi:hypothetical protein
LICNFLFGNQCSHDGCKSISLQEGAVDISFQDPSLA